MASKAVVVPRETVEAKARRYLCEGRLIVERVDERGVRARARGGGAMYELGFDGLRWFCDCRAVGRCCHIAALELVTVGRRSEEQASRV